MGNFCENCGAQLGEKANFCPSCGNAVAARQNNSGETIAAGSSSGGGIGFSDRINSAEVIEHIRKSDKSARGCAFVLIPLPFINLYDSQLGVGRG